MVIQQTVNLKILGSSPNGGASRSIRIGIGTYLRNRVFEGSTPSPGTVSYLVDP
jgi:hypothetical protein